MAAAPIAVLVIIGVVLVVLGILGPAFEIVGVGVGALFGAGVLGVIADRGPKNR